MHLREITVNPHLTDREHTGQEQTPESVVGKVKLHKGGCPYNHGLTAVPGRCHGDQALYASQREGASKWSVLILVIFLIGGRSEVRVQASPEVLGSDVIQEAAEGIPQTKEVPIDT